ncbi:minor capsid protein [Virgibacillus sp. Bac332]|uniref:minor capsid protein n=1 Tax=Virgibacillus sp. Bac332 TaxID=2419842 RepID=UPI000EF4F990|nr:minor capsid protein [Virgibacillus sp. Bac332]
MFKVKVDFDTKKVNKKVDDALGYGQFVLDNLVLKDSNYYIPKDYGYLEESGISHSKIGEGEVAWDTPYARKLYYNPQYNFSKDKNPNARGLWFESAKAKDLKRWLNEAQKATRSKI